MAQHILKEREKEAQRRRRKEYFSLFNSIMNTDIYKS